MTNVRITIIDLETNTTDLINRTCETKKDVKKLWFEFIFDHRAASTGSQPSDEIDWWSTTGIQEKKIITWTQWEI